MSRTLTAPTVPAAHKAGSFASSSVRRQPLPHFDPVGYGSVEAANEANGRADILEAVMLGAALRARSQGSEKLVRRLTSLSLAVPPFAEMARHLATGASTEALRTAVTDAVAWAAVDAVLKMMDLLWHEHELRDLLRGAPHLETSIMSLRGTAEWAAARAARGEP
ncbi:hypothetical protein [Vitiosangium sp. GDMCC 1.1324]|uniref:hypothetical protein n=1 Tax=Vitiosangium sp. (strain GDMCC 1.1324) TaxID=2138576 RepID=UPI000D3D155B|nr:hypothetical protein [Vitiosangium sp. GDMCC 1.1324]PTL75428.1 hypothetical protein DAT35_54925 [Vitiosangium sp. GDMCC 1.1324]